MGNLVLHKLHAFFISNVFIRNARLKFTKIKQKLCNTVRLNFYYLKIIRFLHLPRYHPKIIRDIPKNVQKKKYVCLNEFIWLMAMKIRLKMNKKSHRYDINGSSPNMDINILNVKCVLSIMMIRCTTQHLSNIWSSIHEKVM